MRRSALILLVVLGCGCDELSPEDEAYFEQAESLKGTPCYRRSGGTAREPRVTLLCALAGSGDDSACAGEPRDWLECWDAVDLCLDEGECPPGMPAGSVLIDYRTDEPVSAPWAPPPVVGATDVCLPYTKSGSCKSGSAPCGSGICCGEAFPFYCASTHKCYATADAAREKCGDACAGCGGARSPTECTPVTRTNNCREGYLPCDNSKCCPEGSPFHCDATGKCYGTAAAAIAACGAGCFACRGPS